MPIYIGTLKKYGEAQHWRLEFPVEKNVNGKLLPSNMLFSVKKCFIYKNFTNWSICWEIYGKVKSWKIIKYDIWAWNVLSKVLWTGSLRRRWGFTEREHIQKGFSCFRMNTFLFFFNWKLACFFITQEEGFSGILLLLVVYLYSKSPLSVSNRKLTHFKYGYIVEFLSHWHHTTHPTGHEINFHSCVLMMDSQLTCKLEIDSILSMWAIERYISWIVRYVKIKNHEDFHQNEEFWRFSSEKRILKIFINLKNSEDFHQNSEFWRFYSK